MRFWMPVESSFSLHPWCRQFGYFCEISVVRFQWRAAFNARILRPIMGLGYNAWRRSVMYVCLGWKNLRFASGSCPESGRERVIYLGGMRQNPGSRQVGVTPSHEQRHRPDLESQVGLGSHRIYKIPCPLTPLPASRYQMQDGNSSRPPRRTPWQTTPCSHG